MGFLDFFRAKPQPEKVTPRAQKDVYVGANVEETEPYYQSFNNANITFNGELKGYDYNAI